MTSSELFNKFLAFEEKFNVFNLKTDIEELYWWDIVRYAIYSELNNNFVRKHQDIPAIKKKKSFILLKNVFVDVFYLLKSFLFKKEFFFFLCSRSKNSNHFNFDSVARNFIKSVPSGKSFYLETYFAVQTEYPSYSNIFLAIMKKLHKSRDIKLNFDINKILNEEFQTDIDFYSVVQKNLNNYTVEYNYYKVLLKVLKPKYCFIVQNGIQKALFSVANDLNIECVELQHGQINSFHIAYSYSKNIDYSHLKSFPKYLFTYSEFWNKINFPVYKKISMGKENKIDKDKAQESGDIAFVFANIYTENLLSFVKELAPQFDKKIYIKLHPNQKNELDYVKNALSQYKNIEIVYIEKSMDEILSLVSSVVMIQSTTIYEALQKGKKIFLYKKQDYDTHSDVFDNENVYLIDSVDDFFEHQDKPFVNLEQVIFFEPFNKNKFLSFLEKQK
ncbi:MAG: hypothetical protein KN64_00520 [Sulfurovum sp. AS07-7]|nr:MAG: hypothetical protein KN64_00520 [Sulfurovum sp. AS07-7]